MSPPAEDQADDLLERDGRREAVHGRRSRGRNSQRGASGLSVGVAATVKEKLDIVDLIGETVQLKKAGTTFKGLCPFHGEKTPSFTVTPSRETWKCFGCGRGGDIFNFVMERDGVDFPTALRSLAGRAGVEMSERTSREDAQRKRLRDALEAAISFYHQVLTSHASGRGRARLPPRSRLHRRDHQHPWPGLGAGRLGCPEQRADTPPQHRRGRPRGCRPRQPTALRQRRLRPLPWPRHLPHPRRERRSHGPGGAHPRPADERERAQVPQLPPDAALRQGPHALPHRPCQGGHPPHRPRRARGGQHGCAHGPPGRLRQRRLQHGHGPHGRPGGAPDALRTPHRPGLRRRCRGPERGHLRGHGADRPRGRDRTLTLPWSPDRRGCRSPAGRPRPGRGHPRRTRDVARGHRAPAAHHGVPHRPRRDAP